MVTGSFVSGFVRGVRKNMKHTLKCQDDLKA